MKTIICGSRAIGDYGELTRAIANSGFNVTTVLSGGARGVDRMGEVWARANNRLLLLFPADWRTYGKRAGYVRNEQMAEEAEAVIALWDGASRGTKHMIDTARAMGLSVYVHKL
jgi:hypothetical protein